MRALCILALLWLHIFSTVTEAAPPAPNTEEEQVQAADQRRTLPNNPAPPERRTPLTLLPPLPQEEEGTVRRVRLPKGEKLAALTFDLCELETSTNGYNSVIMDFLRSEGIPATLFMGGKWMRTHAERVLQLMGEPLFSLGNHAWSHGNFGIMSEERMREQILWTQAQYELLREEWLRRAAHEGRTIATPPPPVPTLFRLPYGRCSDAALTELARAGLRVIQWDVVGEEGADGPHLDGGKLTAARVRPGSILLFHANMVPKNSATVLRATVRELQAAGYTFVSVEALLARGEAQRTRDGYFTHPGDNLIFDNRFGIDGTGRRR